MILDEILVQLKTGKQNKAYTINGKSYTYEEFYKYVCNIYNYLQKYNSLKEPVIVYGNKEVYMKAAFVACSFAGITYIPIDISIPKDRIELIIKQCKPKLIIGDYNNTNYNVITVEEINNIMKNEEYEDIETIFMKPEDIYYIIFTSGSTGIPKGVKVTYSNLDSCIQWLKEITNIKKGVILSQAIFSFDLSVADLYLSLVSGSEHFILENKKLDFESIFNSLKNSNISLAVMTPSFAELLLLDKTFNNVLLPKLETILFCGEKLLGKTVKELHSRFDNLKVINSYGPTECTFAVTNIEITKQIESEDNIPVGIAKKDVELFILDDYKNILEDGRIGEILITGASVADGYLGSVEKYRFICFNNQKGYLTGDLGFLKNNILYCVGRKDEQIKYKGYRIELQDIENSIYSLNYIEKVKVIPKLSSNNKVIKLIAFIKMKNDFKILEEQIRKDLTSKIPEYMIPNIKIIDEFPINDNGKIDIKLLKEIVDGKKNN